MKLRRLKGHARYTALGHGPGPERRAHRRFGRPDPGNCLRGARLLEARTWGWRPIPASAPREPVSSGLNCKT